MPAVARGAAAQRVGEREAGVVEPAVGEVGGIEPAAELVGAGQAGGRGIEALMIGVACWDCTLFSCGSLRHSPKLTAN